MAIKELLSKVTKDFKKMSASKQDDENLLIFKKFYIYFSVLFVIVSIFISYAYFQKNEYSNLNKSQENLKDLVKKEELSKVSNYLFTKLKSPYEEHSYTIQNNDSVESILKKFNILENEIKYITQKLRKRKIDNIYSGRKVSLVLKKTKGNDKKNIVNILYPISNTLSIEIRKNKASEFTIKENILKLYKREVVVKNTIKNNLYSAAINAGIEPNIIIEFARIYGFEIDFQRDIRKGNWFEIYYEKFVDDKEIVRDTGKIIYASMYVNNKEINLYNFKTGKEFGYYDLNGKSIVKSLMKTPINGARLSSSFGMRKHPILGYNRMHKGTDFAAPSGTPIMASGSGTITRSRWCGGGGNCVKIKHNSTYETVYAHMKSFAKGIREGRKVRQGQIIGYVGSTGLSTGPHLHYEVIVNGKKVNSQKLKLPSNKILKAEERKNFEIERIKIDLKLSELRKS
tara:strand:- start:273 stop:1640 length:1368 start_codon:yes stop_codon:yes gene_type:complete